MSEDLGNDVRMFDAWPEPVEWVAMIFKGPPLLRVLLDVDREHSFTKALPGFRPLGRRSPFKTAPGGFVSSRAQLMREGAEERGASAWSDEGVLTLTGALGKLGTGMFA